jgi:hypothetical protein
VGLSRPVKKLGRMDSSLYFDKLEFGFRRAQELRPRAHLMEAAAVGVAIGKLCMRVPRAVEMDCANKAASYAATALR